MTTPWIVFPEELLRALAVLTWRVSPIIIIWRADMATIDRVPSKVRIKWKHVCVNNHYKQSQYALTTIWSCICRFDFLLLHQAPVAGLSLRWDHKWLLCLSTLGYPPSQRRKVIIEWLIILFRQILSRYHFAFLVCSIPIKCQHIITCCLIYKTSWIKVKQTWA